MFRQQARLLLLVAAILAFIWLSTLKSRDRPFNVAPQSSSIERIVLQVECPPPPPTISRLPFYPVTGSGASEAVYAPLDRQPPKCRPRTPLFIGFSDNEDILNQAVLSYIASGWPISDIVVVDNTGASYDSHQTYFGLQDGVNVLQTPTQLSFSQLQNFYIYAAELGGWDYFFWSHLDVVVLSYQHPRSSLYWRVLSSLDNITATSSNPNWAICFYNYDQLSLVNVRASKVIGPWDIEIPYYSSDCDYYTRARLRGFSITDFQVGHIFDVESVLPNARQLLLNGTYDNAYEKLRMHEERKKRGRASQKFWHGVKSSRQVTVESGRQVYKKKWGTEKCNPQPI